MNYQVVLQQMIKMLQNLSGFLDKGAEFANAKKFDVSVLLTSRLAPDQFPLMRQIQIACDVAKFATARLSNQENEAPRHPDTEASLADIKTRIESTIGYLKTCQQNDFGGAKELKISKPRWEGKYLTGEEFLVQYVLPNFYFHITTAYAIIRHNGVDLGKKDYLGDLPYKN